MTKIKRLPPHIANQIAAGEVVERPASVVKELVENALDADATSIEISLSKGGKALIEVKDNGSGMSREDLELCIEPHATSKVDSEEDLMAITTLGFRGEALASIGAVSRLSLSSRQRECEEAWRLQVNFGKVEGIRPEACPPGTIVRVQDLFLKTPARAKFLKSSQTEYARCLKVVHLFCAAFPEVDFRLKREGKHVLYLKGNAPLKERVEPLLGRQIIPHLKEMEHVSGPMSLRGYVADPSKVRLSSRHLYFFLNRRPVSSAVLWRAVKDAMAGFLVKGNHPAGVLFLEIPPETVDVNVHPTKLEVRFENPSHIYRLVFHGVRKALEKAEADVLHGSLKQDRVLAEQGAKAESLAGDSQVGSSDSLPFDFTQTRRQIEPPLLVREFQEEGAYGASNQIEEDESKEWNIIGQFTKSYIIFERDRRLFILDQHAAHEALLFQEFISEIKDSGGLSKQNLLIPEVFDCNAEWMENLTEVCKLLEKIGIEAERFGETQLVLRAIPTYLFKSSEKSKAIQEIVELVMQNPASDTGELLRSCLSRLSCALAIKAGQGLTLSEMETLVDKCMRQGITNCPHGRPVLVEIGPDELQKRFFRK